ncbi:MAG: SLBB domain-containing protein [Immundisolibacteraceae bacterium]|nr:SLBB domain-containing protein [Immundisolibacteraceae bacterium]
MPIDIGVLCLNVGTLFALHQAVTQGMPLISRVVTITGNGIAQSQNREVLFGTPIEALLQACGGATAEPAKLIMGGPMMGFALPSAEVPIVKISNCILVLGESQNEVMPLAGKTRNLTEHQASHQPCIRCGDCVSVCPAGLLPQQLYWFAKSGEHGKAEHHHLFDCIECGACAYVCPSKIPLVQYTARQRVKFGPNVVSREGRMLLVIGWRPAMRA